MDLGIAGRKALVCGASAGLGFACAQALVEEGVQVVVVARTAQTLADAAARLAALGGGSVAQVVADVTTDHGRAAILDAHPRFDIVITNAGGPPPGSFRDWTRGAGRHPDREPRSIERVIDLAKRPLAPGARALAAQPRHQRPAFKALPRIVDSHPAQNGGNDIDCLDQAAID